MKWLINVHLEEPHGQRKPHVDKNAQSASTDNTADRFMLGGQKNKCNLRFKEPTKAFLLIYLKLFTFSFYLNLFYYYEETVKHHRVHDEARLSEKTTKKILQSPAALWPLKLNITGVDRLCPPKKKCFNSVCLELLFTKPCAFSHCRLEQ